MMGGMGQRLGANALAGLVLLIIASALIWVAVAFAGYALYLAFLPRAGAPLAAAVAPRILIPPRRGALGCSGPRCNSRRGSVPRPNDPEAEGPRAEAARAGTYSAIPCST